MNGNDPKSVARLELRAHAAVPLSTQEIAVDGSPVWRLTWTRDESTRAILGRTEWTGAMALSHAFIPSAPSSTFSTEPTR